MKLERQDYVYANVHVTQDEMDALKVITQYALDNYKDTQLDYRIDGPAEERRDKLVDLVEIIGMETESPILLDKGRLGVLQVVAEELENKNIHGVAALLKDELVEKFSSTNLHVFFDSEDHSNTMQVTR